MKIQITSLIAGSLIFSVQGRADTPLLNVDFCAGSPAKVGFAAVGIGANDYWNPYSYPYSYNQSVPNLKWSDFTTSSVGLIVVNAPGQWGNGSSDPMLNGYIYSYGGDITVTITNLPPNLYNFYLYGHQGPADANALFHLQRDGVEIGYKGTTIWGNGPFIGTNWEPGIQYVMFENIAVSNQTITIDIPPGYDSYPYINGMQIMASSAVPHVQPNIVNLINVDLCPANPPKRGFAAIGVSTNDYWNGDSHPYNAVGSIVGLTNADGTLSGAGLTVLNAPGQWGFNGIDPMYSGFEYPWDGGNILMTVTNLPPGLYDFYLYGHLDHDYQHTIFQLWSGTRNYDLRATTMWGSGAATSVPWEESQQYIVYHDVAVYSNLPVTIVVGHDDTGYATASGMQIVFKGSGDSNSNGIPDPWEIYYFGNLTNTSGGDFDGDHVSNFREWQLGFDPTKTSSNGSIADGDNADTSFVENALPPGAYENDAYPPANVYTEAWNWTGDWWDGDGWGGADVYSDFGNMIHVSDLVQGDIHQHLYDKSVMNVMVRTGDVLFAYVNLDSSYVPGEVMVQWYIIGPDGNGTWEHRAYWGANNISLGTDGTMSRYSAGALPTAGQWVRIQVPASAVGLEGQVVQGMAFTLYGGRAAWDKSGTSIPDLDGNGLPDAWERAYFGHIGNDPNADPDGDGLTTMQEYQLGTNPVLADTDGDGLTDGEEMNMWVDIYDHSLGHLDPLNADTGNTGVLDGDKDADHDGISNLAELRVYGSDPQNPNTFTTQASDPVYLFTAMAVSPSAGQQPSMARLEVYNLGGGQLQFNVTQAPAGATYDLYFLHTFLSPWWQWRRVYCGITADSTGRASFKLVEPYSDQGFFVILDAHDDDGDGLGNGYETWFSYSGRYSSVSVADTDKDTMPDGWEVAYGLDPTSTNCPNGKLCNPDGDAYQNYQEYNNNKTFLTPTYDPLRNFTTQSPRPVVSISSTDTSADGTDGTANFIIQRSGGSTTDALTVYYAVGGDANYGDDYTLNPSPSEYPRIFSATIPMNQTSVTVTLSRTTLKATGLAAKTVVIKLTPYSVSPATPVSDPNQWLYVVNLFRDTVTINLLNQLPGLNGPVYAIKDYKTVVYNGQSCGEFHELIVGGQFTQAGATLAMNIARYNSSTASWEPLGNGVAGPVYAIEAVERFPGDTSPDIYVGGNFATPAKAIAKWNGASSTWSGLGTGLSSSAFVNTSVRVNALRNVGGALWIGGRFSSGGGVNSQNLIAWNLSSSLWQALGGTIVNCDGSTISANGLPAQTIMVTAIDPAGASIGAALNGITCPFCTATPVYSEAFYTVDSGGTVLRGKCRRNFEAGMRSVLGSIAGHDQLTISPWSPANFESFEGNYSGLSQLFGGTTWHLLGYGGPALPPVGSSPWWTTGSEVSGWKTIGPVSAMTTFGNEIYFGGSFNILSGAYPTTPASHIADYSPFNNVFKWNTSTLSWSQLANSASASCSVPGAIGVNGPIYAMDEDHSLCNGQFNGVWVAGQFTQAGGGTAWNLAFWSAGNNMVHWDVPAAPTLSVSPSSGGIVLPPANVVLTASFSATGCTLAKVDFYEGNALLGTDTSSPYTFTWNGVPVGSHTVTAVATDSNGRMGVSAPLTFRVDAAPTVTLTSPANGASYTAPATISLAATASDTDGTIASVKFYQNGNLLNTDSSAPYAYTWSGVAAGTYTLTAVATDNNGAPTTSAPVTVTVH